MILLTYSAGKKLVSSETEKPNYAVASVSQKNVYSIEIDKETYQFFLTYGTSLIKALEELMYGYLTATLEPVFTRVGYDVSNHSKYYNMFFKDYLIFFQTMKNIYNASNEDAKKFLKEKIVITQQYEAYYNDDELEKLKNEIQQKCNCKVLVSQTDNIVSITKVYENYNIDFHIKSFKRMYELVRKRADQIHNVRKKYDEILEKIEQFSNIDFESLINQVVELKLQVNQFVNSAIEEHIQEKEKVEKQENEKLEKQIVEKTNRITQKLYPEPKPVSDVKEAEKELEKAQSFVDKVIDFAKRMKNKVVEKSKSMINKIRSFFNRKDKNDDKDYKPRGPRL